MTAVVVVLWLLIIPMAVILTTFDCLYHFKNNEDGIRNIGLYSFACGSPDNSTIFDSWIRQVISSPTGSRSLLQVFAAEQMAVPCLDLMIYIIIIVHLIITKGFRLSQKASYVLLVPPFSLFAIVEVTVSRFFSILRFQGSSVLGIFFLTSKMKMSWLQNGSLILYSFLLILVQMVSFPGGHGGGVTYSRYSVRDK